MNFGAAMPGGGEFAYSGLTMQDIKDGKIATVKVDGFVFRVDTQQAGKADKLTGDLANVAAYDVDLNATAAMFDPQKADDDRYYRAYRQISAGPYTIKSGQGVNMRIDGLTIDDVGLQPSRLQLPALLAMMQPAGTVPTPARDLIEKAAGVYEGIRIGNAEMRGLSMETPQGPFKVSAMRFGLENGKVGEFVLEGLDARAPKGPVKVGRFALKSLDIAKLLRMSALFSNPAQRPSPDQALELLPLLEGVEVKGVVAPYKDTNKPVEIDTLSLNWGQLVGPIPSRARLTAKLTGPHRRERRRVAAARRRRHQYAGVQLRSRGGLDRSVTHIRAGPDHARTRRRAKGVGARFARQRAARDILAQSATGGGDGGSNRGRNDGAVAA
jgi:hypothetical protein